MTPGAWWVVAGLMACGAEMLVPGVFLLPVGAAAVVTGVAVFLGCGTDAAWLVFVTGLAVAVGAASWLRRGPARKDATNGPDAGLVGATCVAEVFEGGQGRVRLGDGAWPARMTDRSEPAWGSHLRVVGVDGTTLVVTTLPS